MTTAVLSQYRQGLRVLVVEDEGLIAEEIQDRLIHMGCQIAGTADSGEKAIAAARQYAPQLILMDIRLKGPMDGIQAAEEIGKTMSIPVIYLTAHSDSVTLDRAKHTAPFGYVLKPFQEKDLMVAIEIAVHNHQLEVKLRNSERRYATTLASISDGVMASDASGLVTYLNPVAEALTQRSFHNVEGKSVDVAFSFARESDLRIIENPVRQALRLGRRIEMEQPTVLVTATGETIPIDECATPIFNEDGKICGAVIAFRDIRHRRLQEHALRQAEAQLRQAQKMESIGRLAGGVAHDFNNLLTVINGYTELLLERLAADSTNRSVVEEIRKAGDRAATLTRQLLAFSRKQILQPKVLDINGLVTDTRSMLARLIGENIALTTALPANLWTIKADPGQIEQIIMNLTVNARDAMPQGGNVHIETANVELTEANAADKEGLLPGRFVVLTVSDTGCGMDKSVQEHLFEPFFTTKQIGTGTGLGLSTVYGIVKQSGGHISVDSEPQKGSTIRIYLPAVQAERSNKASTPPAATRRGHETILLVEDEDQVRTLGSIILESHGYHVLTAASGEDAIRIFEQAREPIDLVATDVIMPEMSGPELADHLSRIKPGVPMLYLSGYTNDTIVRNGLLAEHTNFLQKPYKMAELCGKVREILDRSEPRVA